MKTQTSLNILVLEDDLYICKKMSSVLSQYGRVFTANTSKNWKFILETYPIDVAFIDLNLTKGDKLEGLSVVKYCNVNNIYPVVVTNKDDYDVKVRAFRLGAKKYFLKSKIIKNLDIVMGPLLRTLAFDQLDDWIINDFCTQDSTIISKIQDFKEKGVPHDLKLLISGPPGVKKQKVAKLLYKMSRDSRAPFVKLNILQIPPKKHLEAVKDALKKSLNGLLLVKHVNKLSKDAQTFLVSSYPENKNLQLVFTSDIDLFPAIQSNLISKDFYDLFLRNNFQIPSLKNRKKDIDLVFDATSAKAHKKHAPILSELGIKTIDLTPAKIGSMCIPVVNLIDSLGVKNVNMVTCGGQASIPIAYGIGKTQKDVEYIEVVSSIASKSAGPATRSNLDEYIGTTEQGISYFSGVTKVKAILNLNPAIPCINMQTTIFAKVKNPELIKLEDFLSPLIAGIVEYVPGYQLILGPTYENGRIVVMIKVKGLGDYLPEYAGNLDIINCAAIAMAEEYARANKEKE